MEKQKRVRCSSAGRAIACSGSLLPVEHPYDPPSDIGEEGHAGHECMEHIVARGVRSLAAVTEPIAERYSVELGSLSIMVSEGWRAWAEVRRYFPSPQIERVLEGPYTYGRADVVSYSVDHAAVLDWKFGYLDEPHDDQLTAYASCLRDEVGMPCTGYIDTIEVHVRAGSWRHRRLTGEDIDAWEQGLKRHLDRPGSQWAPSTTACRYCPSRMACAARTGYVQASAEMIGQVLDVADSRDALAHAYDAAETMRQALREYDAAVRDVLRDGALKLRDGRIVEMREQSRDTIDAGKAWPVIHRETGWSPDQLLSLLTVPKGALTKAVQAEAVKGEKKKRSDAVMEALQIAGAVSRETSAVKKVSRPKA